MSEEVRPVIELMKARGATKEEIDQMNLYLDKYNLDEMQRITSEKRIEMTVYVMMDAFDTPVADKIVGVYESLEDAVKDANNLCSDDGTLVAVPTKESKIFNGKAYRVVNVMNNAWFYIVERNVIDLNCLPCYREKELINEAEEAMAFLHNSLEEEIGKGEEMR